MKNVIKLNEWWTLIKHGPKLYVAKRKDGECRSYFSRCALEQDFGQVTFPNEEDT